MLDADPNAAALPTQQSVVVPVPSGLVSNDAVDAYFGSVIEQMQEAAQEGDLARLLGLLAAHDDERAPSWARQRFAAYRDVGRALAFEARLPELTEIELQSAERALGAPLRFVVRMRGPDDADVQLAPVGNAFATNVLVSIAMVDHDCLGTRAERRSSVVLQPDSRVRLRAEPMVLPFMVAAEHGGASVRKLQLRAELLPGRIEIDGRGVPNRRVLLAEHALELFPAGVEPIREQPLRTLRNALQLGDAPHFPHVFLATWLMPAQDRDSAIELLVQRVRLGRPDQARCAMAALGVLTGERLTVEDRDGWLRWWQARGGR